MPARKRYDNNQAVTGKVANKLIDDLERLEARVLDPAPMNVTEDMQRQNFKLQATVIAQGNQILALKQSAEKAGDLGSLLDEWADWERVTFPEATTESRLAHLRSELKEIEGSPTDKHEYADAVGLLLLAMKDNQITLDDLIQAMREKLKINKARSWGKPNSEGFCEHIKDTAKPS